MSLFRHEFWLTAILTSAALLVGTLLIAIVISTTIGAWPVVSELDTALLSLDWHPSSGEFGMAAMLAASLAVSLIALVLAAPLAVSLAAWLHLYAPGFLKIPMRALYELLAGIPSVVYGLWGLIGLVPLVNVIAPPGAGLMTASGVLGIMILPYGLLLADSRFRQVPVSQKEAAAAAGLSRWGTFRCVYWPLCRSSIVRGMVLQFGRALGETMAVLMVAGNVVQLPESVFAPVRTLTANIALEMGYASGDHRAALYLSGMVLLGITVLLMALARERA